MKEEEKIIEVINKIKPFVQSDGGDIEFVKYEDNKVFVKLLGACQGCSMAHVTLKEGVQTAIQEEVPTVLEVINVND